MTQSWDYTSTVNKCLNPSGRLDRRIKGRLSTLQYPFSTSDHTLERSERLRKVSEGNPISGIGSKFRHFETKLLPPRVFYVLDGKK